LSCSGCAGAGVHSSVAESVQSVKPIGHDARRGACGVGQCISAEWSRGSTKCPPSVLNRSRDVSGTQKQGTHSKAHKTLPNTPAEQVCEAGRTTKSSPSKSARQSEWPSPRRASLRDGANDQVPAEQVYEARQTTKSLPSKFVKRSERPSHRRTSQRGRTSDQVDPQGGSPCQCCWSTMTVIGYFVTKPCPRLTYSTKKGHDNKVSTHIPERTGRRT
jgi:hypothetical protein